MDFGTGRWIEAGDAQLFMRAWGPPSGRAVLYWHGVSLTSRAGETLGEAADQLARDHDLRMLALDAPGFGHSPALPPAAYHPHALAHLVPAVLDALDVPRAAFMGFSWGGDIGCHAAARHPDRVAALVLLDAGYTDPPFEASLPYEHYLEQNRQLALGTDGATVDPGVVAAVEHGIAQAPPSATRAQLTMPVLLVVPSDTDADEFTRFRADVPQAQVIRVAGSGHDVLARGGPMAVRAVGRWLSTR